MKVVFAPQGLCIALPIALLLGVLGGPTSADELATIKPDVRTGFSNAGWKYDRYGDLPSLDAQSRMTVADLKGPGIIRHIHVTRHQNKELMARGIVLEIWFDEAKEPAVTCPLADFFGDGCNGDSMDFSSRLIECAPWSYNCYFPMPFAKRARVVLRNDTDVNAMDYSYVEWENLPKWDDSLGYFHAAYRRKCFQLTKDSDETFFEVQGTGHFVGRQFSVVTDEPLFRGFSFVMEGNNEVDVDGRDRQLDYLGTEDSFTFSWGFQRTYPGLRAGMTLAEHGDLNRLSIYRFHDHMPIRFNKSFRWHINWQHEHFFVKNPKWAQAVAAGGCWVDYATVYYWYQSTPGGFEHEPLPPLEKRRKTMLSEMPSDLGRLFASLKPERQLENTFSTKEDLRRVHVRGAYANTHPFWIDEPKPEGGHPGNPNPGKKGILAVHAKNEHEPCRIVRKVTLPADKPSALRIVVSGDPYEGPKKSDFPMRAGVCDGKSLKWFPEEVIVAGAPPSAENWRTLEYDLAGHAGQTVALVLEVSHGGPRGVMNEEAFFDEISVVTK